VVVVGVTSGTELDATQFAVDYGLTFPVLTEAEAETKAWGVRFIAGNVNYLVDPEGKVVAQGSDEIRSRLEKEFPGR
jgi:peroxiredoxin